MKNTRTFMISCKEIKKGEQNFPVSTAKINGIWYKIKFTKECENNPKRRGLYDITIDLDDVSVQNGKTYTDKNGEKRKENNTLWVNRIIKIRKYTEEELKERNKEALSKVFDIDDNTDDDDVPF